MCIIVVRKEGENVLNDMLKNVIGTLDFRVKYLLQGETYPILYLRKTTSQKYGIISNVTVSEIKFVNETAKEDDNRPELALYRKMGFEVIIF
ncbi:hypothetical protein MKX03_000795 [Papaver bracteatum]|nr:hypothetical protein MKX03_000795 [Papaver bracteatum]